MWGELATKERGDPAEGDHEARDAMSSHPGVPVDITKESRCSERAQRSRVNVPLLYYLPWSEWWNRLRASSVEMWRVKHRVRWSAIDARNGGAEPTAGVRKS